MVQAHKVTGAIIGAVSMAVLAGPVLAAPMYIKFDGVDGETARASGKDHKDWIIIDSMSFPAKSAARGGVRVATGDVDGDGRAEVHAASHHASGAKAISAQDEPEGTALLLPAVQKVREAAARMPAWAGCRAGQKLQGLQIRHGKRTALVQDAVVTDCGAESVSFNFTKIEWK